MSAADDKRAEEAAAKLAENGLTAYLKVLAGLSDEDLEREIVDCRRALQTFDKDYAEHREQGKTLTDDLADGGILARTQLGLAEGEQTARLRVSTKWGVCDNGVDETEPEARTEQNVWIESKLFPGTCSRCGQPQAHHYADQWCFKPAESI